MEAFARDFPGGFFWALFPTDTRRRNPQKNLAAHKQKSAENLWCQAAALKSGDFFSRHLHYVREIPPGLLQHVLTVLIFWSWVLLLPRLPPWSRSLRLFACASILLYGPLDICLDLLPSAPIPPVQKRDAQHMFSQHRGAHADYWADPGVLWKKAPKAIRAMRGKALQTVPFKGISSVLWVHQKLPQSTVSQPFPSNTSYESNTHTH